MIRTPRRAARSRSARPSYAPEALESRRLLAAVPAGFADQAFGPSFASGTAMAFAPDGRLFALDQNGNVRIIHPNGTFATPIIIPTTPTGERGLLGITFDPGFTTNGFIYLYYTSTVGGSHNRVSRFTVVGNTISAGSEQVIVDLENLSGATNHNGGALAFGPDGKLYVAVGDNANSDNAQSLTSRFGKILRYNADGSIPSDNPATINGLGATSGIYRAIWAAGLRNPYTFTFNPTNGQMFINDVGEVTWEEINVGAPGRNYGWGPVATRTEGYFTPSGTSANYTPPFYTYQHGSGLQKGFAITGGAFYSSSGPNAFPAQYQNKYFFGDYVSDWIGVIDPAGAPGSLPASTAPNFASSAGGVVDLDVGPDGALYYLSRDTIGTAVQGVRRILPAAPVTLTLATSGFTGYGSLPAPTTTLLYDNNAINTGDNLALLYTTQSTPGTTHTLEAPVTQTFNGQNYIFVNWTDGGARSHTVTTPATNTTYTAVYRDATAPAVATPAFSRDRLNASAPPHALSFTFSEGVKPQASTLTLLNQTTNTTTTITNGATLSADARTLRYTFATQFPDGVLPDGRYHVTYAANGVKDLAGNVNAAYTFDFTVLSGDVDSDGDVDFDDLLKLAKNYNTTGKTFAEGNVNSSADGSVNFDDLLVLAKNYNVTLPAAASPDALVSSPTPTRKRFAVDNVIT